MKERIWLSPPHMGQNEIFYINEAFKENWIAPAGPNIKNFEDSIRNFTDIKYAVALNSGTSAIHLALVLLGISAGDEVICSSFTFVASANPIVYQGATPVFVDSEKDSWNMDPKLLKEAILDGTRKGKKPKAIILVHAYGNAAKMDEIMNLASEYMIPVVEDAAESYGSTYKKQMLGSFGVMGVYSFNGNKIITTSSGGALVTNEEGLAKRATYLASQAKDKSGEFEHSDIGYNYGMSNILAGIGLGQMKIIYERIKQRKMVFEYYYKALSDIPAISFNPETSGSSSNRWLTCILIDPDNTHVKSSDLISALAKENIESRTLWKPLHLQTPFKECPSFDRGVSKNLFERGLCLPSGSALRSNELDRVIQVIRNNISG